MTINDIASKLNVDRTTANGLVAFLRAKGLILKVGDHKAPGTRGKPAAVYALAEGADLSEVLAPLK